LHRFAVWYGAVLNQSPTPFVVGEKVVEIVENRTCRLRHLVGPDSEPGHAWRNAMTDEEWVDRGALDDDAWYAPVGDFGMDVRLKT